MFEVGELKDFARTGDQIQCRRSRRLRDPVELLGCSHLTRSISGLGSWPRRGQAQAPRAEPIQPEIFVSYKLGRGQRSSGR